MAITTTFSNNFTRFRPAANGYQTDDQFGSEAVFLEDGSMAIVYGTANSANEANDFPRVTIYDNLLNTKFVSISPGTGPTYMNGDPEMIELANGNLAVMWDELSGASNSVIGSIIDPKTGTVLFQEFLISDLEAHTAPQATALADGSWVVAMHTDGGPIHIQKMSETGVQLGDLSEIDGDGSRMDPVVTGLKDGGWVVTYSIETSGVTEIFAQIYRSDGTVRVSEFLVGTGGFNDQPAVAALDNGFWAVAYRDSGWDAPGGLSLHVISPNGVDITGPIQIDEGADPYVEADPDITILDNDMILVTWTDSRLSGNILGRVFDELGNPVDLEGRTGPFAIAISNDALSDASVDAGPSGRYLVSISDPAPDSDGTSIRAYVYQLQQEIVSDGEGDTAVGSKIADVMYGNGGSDILFGMGGRDFIYGGTGADTLSGGNGTDSVRGELGLDVIYGGEGNDFLYGGENSDTISGGVGDDKNYGGAGNDVVFGASGNDLLQGATGVDILFGGAGIDELYGEEQSDTLYGQSGSDSLYGGGGNDTLSGSSGVDLLYGDANSDHLIGGSDYDFFYGGTGSDTMTGGSGGDWFYFYDGDDADVIQGFEDNVDHLLLDSALWGGAILTSSEIIADYATQTSPGIIDFDFSSGDTIRIFNSAGLSLSEIENDVFLI